MKPERLTAFTDGVIAVIITIMVLEMKAPMGASFHDLSSLVPQMLCYVLSFVYVAIYWVNHHHFFQLVRRVNGAILWSNLNLLFWLSLIPFTTAWLGNHDKEAVPTATYGISLIMAAFSWTIMQTTIVRSQGPDSELGKAIGGDLKGRLVPAIYLAGIGLAFVNVLLADAMYAIVALMWLVPDRRIEKYLDAKQPRG
ncbi:MAG TPA: TMEM175 family protein [Candidatus Tumulicola sp.]